MDGTVYLGLGSNLGDRRGHLASALKALSDHPAISLRRLSSLYETEPIEYTAQDWFYNAVVELDTSLSPHALLAFCQQVELGLGKKITVRKGPRTIDLDLLCISDLVLTTPDLMVPHPMLALRVFALAPLAEIAPQWVHPVLGQTVLELLARLDQNQQIKKIADEGWCPL